MATTGSLSFTGKAHKRDSALSVHPMLRVLAVSLLVIAGASHGCSGGKKPTSDAGVSGAARSPQEVAAEWLTALAHHDAARIRDLSSFPLLGEGFYAPDESPCERVPGMERDTEMSEIRAAAANESEFDRFISCALADRTTVEWVDGAAGAKEFKGSIRILKKLAESGPSLAKYRNEMSKLPKDRVVVEAIEEHGGGWRWGRPRITISALVVLRPLASGRLAVEAVHSNFVWYE
jgi:hypothetical protein